MSSRIESGPFRSGRFRSTRYGPEPGRFKYTRIVPGRVESGYVSDRSKPVMLSRVPPISGVGSTGIGSSVFRLIADGFFRVELGRFWRVEY